jgi:hypothetical protein
MLTHLPEAYSDVAKDAYKLPRPWDKGTLNQVYQLLVSQETKLKAKDADQEARVFKAAPIRAPAPKGKAPVNPDMCTCDKAKKVPHDKDKCVSKALVEFARRFPGEKAPGLFYFIVRFKQGQTVTQCLDEYVPV